MTTFDYAFFAVACISALIAILAWRKSTETLPHPVEIETERATIDSAKTAVSLASDTSTRHIIDQEKIISEFRLTISSLNSQISSLRLSSETLSITLHNALNAMDALHVQVVNLQAENLSLHRQIVEISDSNLALKLQVADLTRNRVSP